MVKIWRMLSWIQFFFSETLNSKYFDSKWFAKSSETTVQRIIIGVQRGSKNSATWASLLSVLSVTLEKETGRSSQDKNYYKTRIDIGPLACN